LKRADIGIEYSSIIKKEILYPFYIDTIPEGKYYSVYHFGSLKGIHITYKSIFSTLNIFNKNFIFQNPPYELYHIFPPFFPEEKSVTEILIPVEH
jgi:effector-binding domain-containing protein